MKKRKYDDDDGRVIANMNVPGMPWYMDSPDGKKAGKRPGSPEEEGEAEPSRELLSKSDTRKVVWSAMWQSLLFALTFSAAMVLLILFCVFVWFKGA